jgi:hypothetical protein
MAKERNGGQLTESEKRARTVPPRVTDKVVARETLNRATRRVKARTKIDFVRTVRR